VRQRRQTGEARDADHDRSNPARVDAAGQPTADHQTTTRAGMSSTASTAWSPVISPTAASATIESTVLTTNTAFRVARTVGPGWCW